MTYGEILSMLYEMSPEHLEQEAEIIDDQENRVPLQFNYNPEENLAGFTLMPGYHYSHENDGEY